MNVNWWKGLFGVWAHHRLALSREKQSDFLVVSAKLNAAFSPALAFLEKARRHGSDDARWRGIVKQAGISIE